MSASNASHTSDTPMEGGTATPALQDNAGEGLPRPPSQPRRFHGKPTPTAPNPPATAGSSSSPLFAVLELQVKAAAAVAREMHDVPLALALLESVTAVLELEATAGSAVARGVQVLLWRT